MERVDDLRSRIYGALDYVKRAVAELEDKGLDLEACRGGYGQRDNVELLAALDDLHDRMVRLHIAVYEEAPTK